MEVVTEEIFQRKGASNNHDRGRGSYQK